LHASGEGRSPRAEGIKGKVGVLGHELVGGGGQGGVEGGEDAELGREGQLVRGGPQERLVLLGEPGRCHHDTSASVAPAVVWGMRWKKIPCLLAVSL
jgi:hypothetical protein